MQTANPIVLVAMFDFIIVSWIGISIFIAALVLWLILLIIGRNLAVKFITFICLLFAIYGIEVLRSLGPR